MGSKIGELPRSHKILDIESFPKSSVIDNSTLIQALEGIDSLRSRSNLDVNK